MTKANNGDAATLAAEATSPDGSVAEVLTHSLLAAAAAQVRDGAVIDGLDTRVGAQDLLGAGVPERSWRAWCAHYQVDDGSFGQAKAPSLLFSDLLDLHRHWPEMPVTDAVGWSMAVAATHEAHPSTIALPWAEDGVHGAWRFVAAGIEVVEYQRLRDAAAVPDRATLAALTVLRCPDRPWDLDLDLDVDEERA